MKENNKYVKDMSFEELVNALGLEATGDGKARLKSKKELKTSEVSNTKTVIIEKGGYSALIETSTDDDVQVEVYEETDAEFGRRVRFHIKVNEYRNRVERMKQLDAKKPWLIKAYKKAKDNAKKAVEELIEMLGR